MENVSGLVLSYRECARHVWNSYFREVPGGDEEFYDVEWALFRGLVLAQCDQAKNWRSEWDALGYYPSLRVVPQLGPKGAEALWCRPPRGNTWNWAIAQIVEPQIELRLIDFFDWRGEGHRDYQYIRCRVLKSVEHKKLVGADLLLEPLSVSVMYDPEPNTSEATS